MPDGLKTRPAHAHARERTRERARERAQPTAALVATYAPGALALALCLIQLTAPHALTGVHGFNGPGWDDGVYLGASFGIVTGHVPYKDFVFMHPPGVPLLMVPVAFLGKLVGLQAAMCVRRRVRIRRNRQDLGGPGHRDCAGDLPGPA